MKRITTLFALIIPLIILSGCEDYLKEDVISGVSYQFYETEEGIEGALVAAYNTLRLGVSSERALTFSDAGTDLFTLGSDGDNSFNQYLPTLSPLNAKISGYWDYHYKGISECNVTLDYLPKVSTMSDERRTTAAAEAKFLRGIYYFDLVQHYGNVPLVLQSIDKVQTSFKRSPVLDIYTTIISDLRYAFDNLPREATARGRAYKAAAAHVLAKVYLARGSATTQQSIRGTKDTDMDSVIYYAGKIVNQELGSFTLVDDFAKLFDIGNQVNSEVVFAVQFSTDLISNGSGNQQHLYHTPQYDAINTKILLRSVEYGRPYRRVRPTPFVYNGLFGNTRMYDSRFMKSFIWAYLANQAATGITTTGGAKVNVAVGDTAVYFTPVLYPSQNELNAAKAQFKRYPAFVPLNTYLPFTLNNIFPGLKKWVDPLRTTANDTNGTRDWMMMRYAETILILGEAYGRKGEYENAAKYINMVRSRAAYKEGELKSSQYWTFEGGSYNDRLASTVDEMQVTAAQISNNFVDFILDERGRELLGELSRWEDLVRCEKLVERVKANNPDASNIRDFHVLRPIPQTHIDRLDPRGPIEEEQNIGYYQ